MEWIKRNLLFVIGAVVALALMGLAFLYLFGQYSENEKAKELLGQKSEELKRLNTAPLQPGNDEINNIKRAREEQVQVSRVIDSTSAYFQPIAPIPDTKGQPITDSQFASGLRNTVEKLRRDAEDAGVQIPTNYYFTFEVQRTNLNFGKENLPPLATKLGEIKTICDVLFAARINALDGIRRERVTPDDQQGFADYLDEKTTTNDLAVVTPYEFTIRCFGGELGRLFTGFADSPHCVLVQKINVEPVNSSAAMSMLDPTGMGGVTPEGAYPGNRYYGRGRYEGGGYANQLMMARARRGRFVPVIEEKPVRVTLWLEVVKLKTDSK